MQPQVLWRRSPRSAGWDRRVRGVVTRRVGRRGGSPGELHELDGNTVGVNGVKAAHARADLHDLGGDLHVASRAQFRVLRLDIVDEKTEVHAAAASVVEFEFALLSLHVFDELKSQGSVRGLKHQILELRALRVGQLVERVAAYADQLRTFR